MYETNVELPCSVHTSDFSFVGFYRDDLMTLIPHPPSPGFVLIILATIIRPLPASDLLQSNCATVIFVAVLIKFYRVHPLNEGNFYGDLSIIDPCKKNEVQNITHTFFAILETLPPNANKYGRKLYTFRTN